MSNRLLAQAGQEVALLDGQRSFSGLLYQLLTCFTTGWAGDGVARRAALLPDGRRKEAGGAQRGLVSSIEV